MTQTAELLTGVSPGGAARGRYGRAVLTDSDRFPFSATDRARLSALDVSLREVPGHDPDDIVDALTDGDVVFVYSARIDRDLLSRFGACRLILRCGSGYDHIDVAAARAAGVEVAYVPGYGTADVAEHTLALMFAVTRRLADLDRAVRGGGWPAYAEIGTMHRLAGARLGLVGFGRIARHVAVVARAMGMQVQAHDPYVVPGELEGLGVTPVTLTGLMATSDVISLHLPLTDATAGCVGEAMLSTVRPGAVLVNTSRGELVDQAALVRALRAGRLAGAGLDVLAVEPPALDDPLRTLPGVVISPHSAAFTEEGLAAVRSLAIDELARAVAGQPLDHPVPPTPGEDVCDAR